jgi:hypothetical protein
MKHQIPKKIQREIFVLTPEEKRIICFVLIAFVLGLATKYHRTAHSLPSSTAVNESASAASHSMQKGAETKRAKRSK